MLEKTDCHVTQQRTIINISVSGRICYALDQILNQTRVPYVRKPPKAMEELYDEPGDQQSVIETTERDEAHVVSDGFGLGLDGTAETFRSRNSTPHARSLRPRSSAGDSADAHVIANGFSSSGLKPTSAQIPTVIIPRSRKTALPYSSSRSGLVYDSRMRYHVDSTETSDDAHPEKPGRILEIFSELVKADLVQDPENAEDKDEEYHLVRIPARKATEAELCLIHSPEHIDFVRSTQGKYIDLEMRSAENISDTNYHQIFPPRRSENTPTLVAAKLQFTGIS